LTKGEVDMVWQILFLRHAPLGAVEVLLIVSMGLKKERIGMIIEISVAVIAIAFVILVVYLIMMIKALRVTLGQVNQTLIETRKQLGEVGLQAQKVMEHTNQISFDLKHKVEAFTPIFNAVTNAGEILEHKTSALKKEFLSSENEEIDLSGLHSGKKKTYQALNLVTVAAILELAGIGTSLWQKLKKRR
jgi:uncharacterized protein YoxC